MSYLVYGSIMVGGGNVNAVAVEMVRAALKSGVYVLVGENVSARDIVRVLEARCRHSDTHLRFSVTSSVTECTAHDLLDPDEGETSLSSRISMLGDWVVAASAIPGVTLEDLFVTEGYDDQFEKVLCSAPDFANELITRIRQASDVQSLWFKM